ncbi:hypothetical protein [Lentzea guizhouensis]|nr:hypothetical protein [Lentzea guizhouensis]
MSMLTTRQPITATLTTAGARVRISATDRADTVVHVEPSTARTGPFDPPSEIIRLREARPVSPMAGRVQSQAWKCWMRSRVETGWTRSASVTARRAVSR